MAAQDIFNPGQEGVAVTASPNLQTVQAQYDPNGSANRLIQALGADSTQRGMADFTQAYERKKLQDQSMKIDHYTQQFANDHVSGAVSQAQVKERFPEMVPVIAARVAESIGKNQGALNVAPIIEHINGNDDLRLSTTARAAYIAQKREELSKAIPAGNDFYSAGVVSAMDRAFGEQELKWQGQTADYHEAVQKNALSGEVATALGGANPGTALETIFQNYKMSSSINPLEFNKVAVDATIKLASQSDDPSILQRLPQRYLNVDSKAAIFHAGIAITNQQWAKFTRAKEFEQYQRDEVDRKGKLDILGKLGNNQDVDPAQYINSPALHSFAVDAMSTPSIPEASSKSAVQAFRQSLLASSNVTSLGSQADVTKAVMGLKGTMNPKDMAALVDEVPKLMEGKVLMNDPIILEAYKNNIGFRLDDLMKTAEPNLQRMLNGTNIRGNAMSLFEGEIRGNFQDAYKETGQWPQGFAARKITEAAVAKTAAYIDTHSSLKALSEMSKTAPAASQAKTPSAPQSKPTATSSGLPKGVTLAK